MGGVKKGYRLRLSSPARWLRVAAFVLCGAALVGGIAYAGEALVWKVVGAVGVLFSILAVRAVVGAVVVVTPDALVVQPVWPARRRIRWYRIDHAEVIPGAWTILVELNSGDRFELPCVEDIDELYRAMEHHRTALDSA
jgi:hypothetical protein